MEALNEKYIDNLYEEDTEGYISIMQLKNGKVIKIYNTNYSGVRKIVEEVQEGKNEDVYMSPNTYYIPKRKNTNIRQFRALYIDLDITEFYKTETVYMVYELVDEGKLPIPTLVVDSGRGIHLYWSIENAPYGAIQTWQELEDYLYHQLKHLGADIKATDGARILRLPGTINSRNKQECKVLISNDVKYSMYDLRKEYLGYVEYEKQVKNKDKLKVEPVKQQERKNIKHLFNSYTLHIARAKDIETLCKLRGYNVEGYRNFIIHCYAYWKGIYTRDHVELESIVMELNRKFIAPLSEADIRTTMRSVEKAIEKFITYEQGIRSGENKRVSKGMRDKGGYWYKNDTLIEYLDIKEHEQNHLKTIIGTKEKYSRNNTRRRKERRNEQGMTLREQQKQDNIHKVKELYKKGLKQKEIVEKLGLSKQTVSWYIKEIKKVQ